jgi:hypothetical protein
MKAVTAKQNGFPLLIIASGNFWQGKNSNLTLSKSKLTLGIA